MQILHLLGADLYWVVLVQLAAEALWPVTSFTSFDAAIPTPATPTHA
jgi:hypothetical protein